MAMDGTWRGLAERFGVEQHGRSADAQCRRLQATSTSFRQRPGPPESLIAVLFSRASMTLSDA